VKKVLFTAVAGLCLCYVILWVLKSPPAALHQTASAGLTWQECWFPTPTFSAVYCGYLRPDHEAQVAVVLIRRSLFARELQPLLYVTGGPGAATIPHDGNIESWVQWLQDLDLDRDLVLFDFLGTGRSSPAYICPKFAQVGPQILATSLSADGEAEIYDRITKDCYQDLSAKKVDLSKFTLPYTIKYVSQLLQILPTVGWDIYGVSYGTRVVLELMRQPPPNIRAVVLDSVLPPDVDMYHMRPRLLKDALQKLFDSCNYDRACKQQFPDLESEFYALFKKLDSQPLQYRVSDNETGTPVMVMINGQRLLTLVYMSMYRWDFIQRLPGALWAAKDGNTEPLRPMVEYLSNYYTDKAFNDVVFISAGCAERRHSITKETMRKEASLYPQLQEYLRPTWKYDECEYWTVPAAGDNYFQPVQSNLPTLLLTGELDPVTPSIWAKHVQTTLRNSFLLVAPGIGHDVIDSNKCAMVATQTFLRKQGTYTGVRCQKNLRAPKFVTAFKS
jgi:pimeloyl-ACP methyl ester carboxylesterase